MKVNGIEVFIKKAHVALNKTNAAADLKGIVDEKAARCACVRVLERARRLKANSVVFLASTETAEKIPRVALAKIMAQEILRFAREEKKHAIRRIDIALSTSKDLKIFKKTIYGYLNHVIHKLSHGPYITVDAIIETGGGIVLIKRSNPPFGWALPGGFVDYGETLEEAVKREMKEETGLVIRSLKQMHTYSDPHRDPRFHTITTVFVVRAKGAPLAGSDAAQARIFKKEEWQKLPLAFDHGQVLKDYLRYKKI